MTPKIENMAFNFGRLQAIAGQLVDALEWYANGPKHPGDCCFTDKAEEGCYLCREAEKRRYTGDYSLLDRAKQLIHECRSDEDHE